MMPAIAIIAGGYAARLYPITRTMPKSMIEVAGRPFIAHQLALLKKNDINQAVVCAGHLGGQIENFVGAGEKFGLSVSYSMDGEKMLGTGGAVKKALPLLGDVFFVMYGDSYLDVDFKTIYDYFLSCHREGLMTVIRNNNQWDKSNVVFEQGVIIRYDKKEKSTDMRHIDYGLSMFRKSAFDQMDDKIIFDLVELHQRLIAGNQLLGYEVKNRFYEIGSSPGLAETREYFMRSKTTG